MIRFFPNKDANIWSNSKVSTDNQDFSSGEDLKDWLVIVLAIDRDDITFTDMKVYWGCLQLGRIEKLY